MDTTCGQVITRGEIVLTAFRPANCSRELKVSLDFAYERQTDRERVDPLMGTVVGLASQRFMQMVVIESGLGLRSKIAGRRELAPPGTLVVCRSHRPCVREPVSGRPVSAPLPFSSTFSSFLSLRASIRSIARSLPLGESCGCGVAAVRGVTTRPVPGVAAGGKVRDGSVVRMVFGGDVGRAGVGVEADAAGRPFSRFGLAVTGAGAG